jgi:hypothetical protein
VVVASLSAVFVYPYVTTVARVSVSEADEWDREPYQLSHFLAQALNAGTDVNGLGICYRGYDAHLLFYVYALVDRGEHIGFADCTSLKAGERVIAAQSEVKAYIEATYHVELLREHRDIREYRIRGRHSGA